MPDTLDAWLAKLEKRHHSAIDLGLDRCRAVWENLGMPRPADCVFTIAGTNGKGSTVAYLDHVLRSCGKTSARYTSPHLLSFTERIVINGAEVSPKELVKAFEHVEAHLSGVSLSYFEFTTLAAFVLMARSTLDCAVLEVGLGGRLDAVNLVDPDCAVITPIGLDHQEYLGDNIEQIGYEKAGIMRGGIPVVCGDRNPPASLAARAKELGAEWLQLGHEIAHHDGGGSRRLRVRNSELPFPPPPLPGDHQLDNFATSLAAIETVFPGLLHNGDWVPGLGKFLLPGRLSTVAANPAIVIDVGHNPLAAEVLAGHIQAHLRPRVHCVLGMLRDKDAGQIARILSASVFRWYCAGLPGPRGRSGRELVHTLRNSVPGIMAAPHGTVGAALDSALDNAGSSDTVIVFGSFETAARAMAHLGIEPGELAASQAPIS
ncbi:MAG: bifunctional folylpolyglutamate synthase/dihydrofolate synthase [Xanthomonadales bacterium]|nr:bifunctional folylpolyglutamate synthase/dihydrofolate synthase [Xanthomonadales bacterium]